MIIRDKAPDTNTATRKGVKKKNANKTIILINTETTD